jgi:hypothetical protein
VGDYCTRWADVRRAHCKGPLSCENEIRDLRVMRERIKWEGKAPERMRYCTARASISKGAIYSWHKAHPSILITYHTATPFPNPTFKGFHRRSPRLPFHNITFRQTHPYWTLRDNIGSTDDPDAFIFFHISPFHIITS